MKPLVVKGYEGNHVQYIKLYADPKRQQEPEELRIKFPGGEIYTARTSDNEHWAHICIDRDEITQQHTGEVKRVRADFDSGVGTLQFVNENGEIVSPNFYHMAVLIAPVDKDTMLTLKAETTTTYIAWCSNASPEALLDEYALLCDGRRCETVPGFLQKRHIVREELYRRLQGDTV